jgi:hypothetical protein
VSCAREIESNKKFCGYCGASQPTPIEPGKSQPTEKALSKRSKVKLPKIKISRKMVALIGASLVAVSLTVGVVSFLSIPPSLSKDDVSAIFKVHKNGQTWIGDKVEVTGLVSLDKNNSTKYRVSLDAYKPKTKSWVSVTEMIGKGPGYYLSEITALDASVNKFRLSISRPDESSVLYSSKVYSVKAKSAYLPSECPYKEFLALIGPDSGMTMDAGTLDGDTLFCTLYPSQGGDYVIDLAFTKMTDEAWTKLRNERSGTPLSLGLGETDAYSYMYSDELSGTYEKYIVNYHGVMIDSDWGTDGIQIALNAIEVK